MCQIQGMNLRVLVSCALLVSACGGQKFEADSSTSAVDDHDGGSEPVGPDGTQSAPGDTGNVPSTPSAECPARCPVIAICQLCDDGSCAEPKVACNADGSCGNTTWECTTTSSPVPMTPATPQPAPASSPTSPAPPTPTPTPAPEPAPTPTAEPTGPAPTGVESGDAGTPEPMPTVEPAPYEPCAGKACGDECDACAPGLECLVGVGYCTLDGNCSPAAPTCDTPEPSTCNCPIPKICQVCEADGSCAMGVAQCDAAGECSGVDWICPETDPAPECKTKDDCIVALACKRCDNGADWCPSAECKMGQCGVTPSLCPEDYKPCAGKADGETCTVCSPLDMDCIETSEEKVCSIQQCEPAATAAQ